MHRLIRARAARRLFFSGGVLPKVSHPAKGREGAATGARYYEAQLRPEPGQLDIRGVYVRSVGCPKRGSAVGRAGEIILGSSLA